MSTQTICDSCKKVIPDGDDDPGGWDVSPPGRGSWEFRQDFCSVPCAAAFFQGGQAGVLEHRSMEKKEE